MEHRILPIGTVVKLKDAEEYKFMIIGYYPTNEKDESKDYVGVRYPMGAYNSSTFFYFNQSDITEIVHEGHKDEEYEALSHLIDQTLR